MDLPEVKVSELIQGDDRLKWIAHSNHSVRCFTEDEISKITNNYKTILGRGAFGEVYEGVLQDGGMVAVKKFIHNVKENFAKELTVHREINHKNVVRLIGYCIEENALMMITEYIPKGNLNTVLHHGDIITLDTRLKIAIECAEALGYMHSQMYTQVIHGDIKPANILLDEKFNAKVSDFGISRLVNTDNTLYTMHVIGSIGYMDPLFARSGRLTAKSDVYSFGVVLLELITRKKAKTDDGDTSLVDTFTRAHSKGVRRVREMFDAEIVTSSDMKIIEEIAKLAAKCLGMELEKRPEMLEVAEKLRMLQKAQHRTALFPWARRNRPFPTEYQALKSKTTPSEEKYHAQPESSEGSTARGNKIVSLGSASRALQVDLDDLLRASAEVLGKSSVGTTYKATLESGDTLVVKRLKGGGSLPKAEFEQRSMMIGALQNEYLMPLRGYYYSKDELLLVYDYMPMGGLSAILHGNRGSDQAALDWETRSAIALAVAFGVASIHSAGPSSCHGNIKSSNVLLTSAYEARLSEHGVTTLVDPLHHPPGTFSGCRAPEAINLVQISHKADIYSFGILLLELLTGKKPQMDSNSEGVDLPRWVSLVVRMDWTSEVLDVALLREGDKEEGIVQLLQLAMNCCVKDADQRPTMDDIVQRIKEIRRG